MKVLYVLAAIAAVGFLLGQIRVGGRAEYSAQGLSAWLRLGKLNIQLFPRKKKEVTEQKQGEKQKKFNQKKQQTEEKPTHIPVAELAGGLLPYVQSFLPIVLEAAGRFYRKLQMDKLELELTVGAANPADAALRYGQASGCLGALWYPLTKAFHVKDGSARVRVDFDAGTTTLYGSASLSLRIGQIVRLGLYFGRKSLMTFLSLRKQEKIKQQQRKAA